MTPAIPVQSINRRTLARLTGAVLAVALGLAAIRFSPGLLVALPLLVIGGLVLLRWPWLGVALLIVSVPVQQVGAVAGGAVTLTRVSILVALGGLLLWWMIGRRPIVGSALAWPFVALLGWMVVTAHVASNVEAAASDIVRWSIAFFAFLAALQVLVRNSENTITVVIVAVAVAGAAEAALGSALGLLGFGPESFLVADAFSRAYGSFGRPNTFAGYLEMAFFPALWFGLYRLGRLFDATRAYASARHAGFTASTSQRHTLYLELILSVILLGSAMLMLTGIMISFSRGAWLGVAAGGFVTTLIAIRRYWRVVIPAAPLLVLVGIAVLVFAAPATLTDRVASISDEARPFDASSITITDDNFAVVERMAHWQAGWRMFEDHPVAGVGAGNFNERYPDYFVREEFRISQGHAHNFYIHMLAENGIVGLALYLVLVLSFALVALRVALSDSSKLARALALGSLGTMTAVYVHNVFENLHVLNLGIQLSVAWAMAVAAYGLWIQSQPAPNTGHMEYSRE